MATIENINGFIWAKVSDDEAIDLWENNIANIFMMWPNEDYYFREIDDENDIENDDDELWMIVQIGAKEELEADYQESKARNNENRSFEEWCLSKIEM